MWGDCNKGLSDKPQKLQNRAARILMSASSDSNLNDFFQVQGGENSVIRKRLHKKKNCPFRLPKLSFASLACLVHRQTLDSCQREELGEIYELTYIVVGCQVTSFVRSVLLTGKLSGSRWNVTSREAECPIVHERNTCTILRGQ